MVGDGFGGRGKNPPPSPASEKGEKMENEQQGESASVEIPYSMLPEGCESGHTLVLTGVVTYAEGDEDAMLEIKSVKKAAGKKNEPSVEEAYQYAKRKDSESGADPEEEINIG